MAEIINITNIRGKLLKTVDNLRKNRNIIITRNYKPAAVLVDIKEYEKKYLQNNTRMPALMILGAKKCDPKTAIQSVNTTNSVCDKYYSKIIFIYGNDTKKYCSKFKTIDLRTVYNKKNNLPVITSIKCGINALSSSDKYFVVVFLSQPQDKKTLITMSNAAIKTGNKIIISRRNGKPVHPIAFSADCKNILIKTRKELGIPHIIKKIKDKIMYVNI
ncbi:MAG: type II toxin-antitoxin system Phd/YefM family antitoxin [Elusimicrobiota bacterium]|nr:type II toxin-antitoxin system Phd/YefM family antitoxin [Elusimicrobiota bacterium]